MAGFLLHSRTEIVMGGAPKELQRCADREHGERLRLPRQAQATYGPITLSPSKHEDPSRLSRAPSASHIKRQSLNQERQ